MGAMLQNVDSILLLSVALGEFKGEGDGEGCHDCVLEILFWLQGGNSLSKFRPKRRMDSDLDNDRLVLLIDEQNCRAFRSMGMGVLCCHDNMKGGRGTKLPEVCLRISNDKDLS